MSEKEFEIKPWQPRAAAGALLALILAAAWIDQSSALADKVRHDKPLAGMLSLRFKGQGRVVPPTNYLAVYGPVTRRLELVRIDASTPLPGESAPKSPSTLADIYGDAYAQGGGNIAKAAMQMGRHALSIIGQNSPLIREPSGKFVPDFWVFHELPAKVRPAFSRELKRQLKAAASDPWFWLRAAANLGELQDASMMRLPRYDALILARELARVSPKSIYLADLPAGELMAPFLGGVFARAAGTASGYQDAVTVEVLNAAGVSGVAMKATKLLRLKGFEVAHFGNAPARERAVRSIDRAGRPGAAETVAKALGCDDAEVLTQMVARPQASVTLLLGRDFERCSGFAENP